MLTYGTEFVAFILAISINWVAILCRNIEAVDSLIDTLADRESKPQDESEDLGSGNAYTSCMKHPKSDSTVIEELHTLNSKLRELISQLLNQLEESQKEASVLREKVKFYESLHTKKDESNGEQNLIDFNSLSSSGESIGIIPWSGTTSCFQSKVVGVQVV